MLLKSSQQKVVHELEAFFRAWKSELGAHEEKVAKLTQAGLSDMVHDLKADAPPLRTLYHKAYGDTFQGDAFRDLPATADGTLYPRLCLQVPTGGGKTLLGVKAIELFHEQFLEKSKGLVVWIVHSEAIYRQTIEKLQDKTNPYRQILDQMSGDRTRIVEKSDTLRYQDIEENLVVLMLMIQSANQESKENLKVFKDSGVFMDFFPHEHEREKIVALLEAYPSLECFKDDFLGIPSLKTSLGNVVRVCNPLFVVDEFHKVYTDAQRKVLDSLNPRCIVGLSATPKPDMNVLVKIKGMDLYRDEMIKLPINVRPEKNDNWRELIHDVRDRRDELEKIAKRHGEARGDYIRPIALLQAERTGKDKRDGMHVHADDIKDYLSELGIPASQIAIKSSYVDELKDEVLLSDTCEIRYIITKQALMEGWDCPFAYVLGVVSASRSVTALTQLVGRVLRQPYTKRTGVPELDQCYTFFNHSDGQELLHGIKKSLEADGLEDVVDTVRGTSGPSGRELAWRAFPIQPHFKRKYASSLALPLWHIQDGKRVRVLSYRSDILPRIDWHTVDIAPLLQTLRASVGQQKVRGKDLQYFLGDTYQGDGTAYEKEGVEGGDEYIITQIVSEHITNPFVAFSFVERVVAGLSETFSREIIESDFGYIAHELASFVKQVCHTEELAVFNALVEDGTVFLAITEEGGYHVPEKYNAPAKESEDDPKKMVPIRTDPKSLHGAVDFVTMNNLEKQIVEELGKQDKVLWWMRNKVEDSFYHIQAWRKNKIYPDFVIAKQNDEGKVELVYILESKGDQLAENLDTKYKELVFQKMTESAKRKAGTLKTFSQYDFQMVPQSETRRAIRELFK